MKKLVLFILIFCVLLIGHSAIADEATDESDRTLSPYFLVRSDDAAVDQLPLKVTSAEVNIAGVIADVVVSQVYKNEGESVLEAIYVFPASTRAAVYGMTMKIGERTIVAEIQKKEEARENYEIAKEEGKSASLLEQQRPNVFQMNVANIMPGDEITVELCYTELLVPTDSIYEFVYPTVVGPRYSNTPTATADPSEKWVANPYLHEGEAPTYTFDIQVTISAGLPIQHVSCNTHTTNTQYEGESVAVVMLDESEKEGGNRDFILKYQLAGNKIESGLLLYEGEDENFFLLMVQPPKRVVANTITPREYIFIVDVSGSMRGFPLEVSKSMLKDLISNLNPEDRFNVLLFASSSSVMSEESLPATEENIKKAIDLIDNQRGGGGTNILPALKRALALPRDEEMSRTIVPVTDGYVTVETAVFDLIRTNLGEANLFAFGIGSSVNRHIIEGMAHVGMGEPFIITQQNQAASQGEKFRNYIGSPVLTQVNLDFGEFEIYDIEPPSIPDVLAERPVICFGKWQGNPDGIIELNGFSGDGVYEKVFNVGDVQSSDNNSALRYLWARHRIMILGDYNKLQKDDERVEIITNLGLQYNLLTDYTSFIAIDTIVRNESGESTTIKQALPLPQGVTDYAVGSAGSSATWSASTSPSAQTFSGVASSGGFSGGYGGYGAYGGGYGSLGGFYGGASSNTSYSSGGTSPATAVTQSSLNTNVAPSTQIYGLGAYNSLYAASIYSPPSSIQIQPIGYTNAVRSIQTLGYNNTPAVSAIPYQVPLTTSPWELASLPLSTQTWGYPINTPLVSAIPYQVPLRTSPWELASLPLSTQIWGVGTTIPLLTQSNITKRDLSIEKVTILNNEIFESSVREVINTNLYKLNFCWQTANNNGSFEVRIVIDANGNVIFPTIIKNEIGETMGECFLNQIKQWKFTGLNSSTMLTVQIHFRLSS